MASVRFKNITYIRFAATLMVVAYHSLCLYTNRWNYSGMSPISLYEHLAEILNRIDMPAFVFISGYLFSSQLTRKKFQNIIDIIIYKFRRLFIPYIFWMIINLLLIPELFTFTKFLNGFNHLWFLSMLLQLFLITTFTLPLWTRLSIKKSLLCFAGIQLFIFVAFYKGWNLPLPYIKTFLPVFYLGIITERFQLLNFKKHYHQYILPFAIANYILVCVFFFTCNPSIRDIAVKISAYSVIFLFMGTLRFLKGNPNKDVMIIDKYSMGIYLIHHIIIQFALTYNGVVHFLENHYVTGPLLIFGLSFSVSLLLTSLITRIPYLRHCV